VQRTAALRAEHTARPNAAPVAVIHNLASQTFYDEIYSLPTGLTIGTEAYTNRVDLRSAEEPRATKDLAKSTKAIRKNLPAKIDDLWQWLLDLPQNVLLNVLAAARAASLSLSKYHQAGLPLLQGQPPTHKSQTCFRVMAASDQKRAEKRISWYEQTAIQGFLE